MTLRLMLVDVRDLESPGRQGRLTSSYPRYLLSKTQGPTEVAYLPVPRYIVASNCRKIITSAATVFIPNLMQ